MRAQGLSKKCIYPLQFGAIAKSSLTRGMRLITFFWRRKGEMNRTWKAAEMQRAGGCICGCTSLAVRDKNPKSSPWWAFNVLLSQHKSTSATPWTVMWSLPESLRCSLHLPFQVTFSWISVSLETQILPNSMEKPWRSSPWSINSVQLY